MTTKARNLPAPNGMLPPERASVARLLADITFALASANDPPRRVSEVLEATLELLAADRAALLAQGAVPLLAFRPAPADDAEAHEFERDLRELAERLEAQAGRDVRLSPPVPGRLAAPLVNLDAEMIGLLAVTRAGDRDYSSNDLQLLAVVAGQLSSYLAWVAWREERAVLQLSEQSARQRAEAANRAKDVFLASLSHELRTPLNVMLGWARLLCGAPDDEARRQKGLEVILRSAEAQARLIDDLLDVSRIASGTLRLDRQRTELVPVLDATVESIRETAASKGVELSTRYEANPVIIADPGRLQQIVWNLLANAVKFTPRGGRVELTAAEAGTAAEICVRDTGIGIAPAFFPQLFHPFQQADASPTRSYSGLGLGLAIVRQLTELHGGHVEGTSEGEGCGACFRVRLPLAEAAGMGGGSATESPRGSA